MLKYLPVSQEYLKIANLLSTPDEMHLGLIYHCINDDAVTNAYRQERRGEAVTLHVRRQKGCTEHCLWRDVQSVESLWERIIAQTYVGDVMDVCYTLPEQE